MPQLLAPGGSLNSALAALEQGADALYIGLKGHSRGGAKGELKEKELALCLEKVKDKGKKLFLAFNLIPEAKTLPTLLNKIEYYASRGMAGVILNEPGLIQLVARKFPSLNITASIGCAIGNLQEAQFYQDLGAKSLVLGPHLGIKEIAQIKAEVDCQVEVFIYGFHEMFTLGKCWLGGYVKSGVRGSEFGVRQNPGFGVRNSGLGFFLNHESRIPNSGLYSAKRSGACGQVCRLVRDISTSAGAGLKPAPTMAPQPYYVLHSIKALVEAGVDVFKLGGRYFRPEDTPLLVAFYRHLLNSLLSLEEKFSWEPWEAKARKLFYPYAQELNYKN